MSVKNNQRMKYTMRRPLPLLSLLCLYQTPLWAVDFNWSYELGGTRNSACLQNLREEHYAEAIKPCTSDAENGDVQAQANLVQRPGTKTVHLFDGLPCLFGRERPDRPIR